MALNKKSKKSDALANLYRAALFLARGRGEEKLAINLLKKSALELPDRKKIKSLLKICSHSPLTAKKRLILAEKILDQYLFLK